MKRLRKARTRLLISNPFFGTLALRLELVEADTLETMATDGTHLFFNPAFVDKIDDDQLVGVLAHEVLHCANLHPFRRGERDPSRWNEACDYAINDILFENGFRLPDGALHDPRYADMAAERIYETLRPKTVGGTSGNDATNPSPPTSDPGGCGGVLDPQSDPGSPLPAPQAKQAEQEWQVAVIKAHQTAKAAGHAPAGLDRTVEAIKNPKIDWRTLLSRFVSEQDRSDYSWSRPNPRYLSQGLILPSLHSPAVGEIVIACDTSGSINQQQIDQVNAELNGILKTSRPSRVTVLHCDSQIQSVERFTTDMGSISLKPVGYGGTDLRPPFTWCRENGVRPSAIIYFTDLISRHFPQSAPAPTLWITPNDRTGPFGRTISLRYG